MLINTKQVWDDIARKSDVWPNISSDGLSTTARIVNAVDGRQFDRLSFVTDYTLATRDKEHIC